MNGNEDNLLIIDKVRHGDRKFLQELYDRYRREFETWAMRHYSINADEVSDIYQQLFMIFYCNVRDKKLTTLSSSVKTYLFAIGKNLIRTQIKTAKPDDPLEVHIEAESIDYSIMEHYENLEIKEKVRKLLDRIGEPCKSVLELYYFHSFSLEAIAQRMNYKTEQIVAKRKFICLKQLRSLMKVHP